MEDRRAGPGERTAQIPRIYYYKTRHYRPELIQQPKHTPSEREQSDEEGSSVRPTAPPTPLVEEQAGGKKDGLQETTLYLSHQLRQAVKTLQAKPQLAVCVLVLLVAGLWLLLWNGDSTGAPATAPGSQGGIPFPTLWEQRMRGIAAEEANSIFSERTGAIDKALDDLKEGHKQLLDIIKEVSPNTPAFEKELDKVKRHLLVKFAELEAQVKDSGIKIVDDYSKEIALLKAEATQKIGKAVEEGISQRIGEMDAAKLGLLRSYEAQLETLQQKILEISTSTSDTDVKVDAVHTTVNSFPDTYASKDELASVREDLEKLSQDSTRDQELKALNEKLAVVEERIQKWVDQIIVPEFIQREILKVLQNRPAMEAEKIKELEKVIMGQKDQLAELVKRVNAISPNDKDYPKTPQEIVQQARPTIDKWIRDAIAEATPSILDGIKAPASPAAPPSTDISEQQKQQIRNWLESEYFSRELPRLVEKETQKLSDSVSKQVEQAKKAAVELEERIRRDREKKISIDKETIEFIVRQLKRDRVGQGLTEEEVKKIVEIELDTFAADRINTTDYALVSGGASVVFAKTSPSYRSGLVNWMMGSTTHSPTILLRPGNVVGECWAFAGSWGYVTVRLPFPIEVSAFSLDHVPSGVAVDSSSAPMKFRVWGLRSPSDADPIILGEDEYSIQGKTVQTFPVQTNDLRANETLAFQYVMLEVLSNHGNAEYTCVYRFRVHGQPVVPLEAPAGRTDAATGQPNMNPQKEAL